MKKIITLLSILCLLGTPAAHAAFQTISTFQDGSLATFLEGHSPTVATGGSGGISVVTDPFGSATNKVLKLSPGTFVGGIDVNNVWFTVPIPAITGKATIYYRFAATDDTNDLISGTTLIDPQAYGDYSSILRHKNIGVLDYYNNTGYIDLTVDGSYPAKHWIQVWQVVDASANTYDVWVQGDTNKWTTPTKIVTGAVFRNKGSTPVKYFSARASSGSAANPSSLNATYFDDIYVDTAGENITIPAATPPGNGTGQLLNVSTRAAVGAGANVLIAGFVVDQDSRKFLIRGVGPGLAAFNVPGTLVDPVIQVFASGNPTPIASNDNWGSAGNAAEITAAAVASGAFALPPNSLDAAMVITLAPGAYTVIVSGNNNATGVAIAEVYRLQ